MYCEWADFAQNWTILFFSQYIDDLVSNDDEDELIRVDCQETYDGGVLVWVGQQRPIVECWPEVCQKAECKNRLVQFGSRVRTEVRPCSKGRGLFALDRIAESEFLFEYAGLVLDVDQRPKNERYCLRVISNGLEFGVDASSMGNESRFMNHACFGAASVRPVLVWTPPSHRRPRIAFFATRPILANEEITFDYGWSSESAVASSLRCLCGGGDACRRYLPFEPKLE